VSGSPRLSVGLPVYNGEPYLRASIESLLGQSYENFELIISDNASTDNTADICRDYAKSDSRVRYFRQPSNIGLAPNHNFVFAQSRGELFKWAANDDLYARDLLRCCVEALDAHPEVILAHSWSAVIDENDKVTQALEYPLATDSSRAPERFRSIIFGCSGMFEDTDPGAGGFVRLDNSGILRACDEYGVIRSAVLRQVSPLGSYPHSDRILNIELALRGPFHQTPDWLYFRRDHPDRTYNANRTARKLSATLDPRRASKWKYPAARLAGEYVWRYLAAIRRAPLSAADRVQCYRSLAQWTVDRAVGKVVTRELKPFGDLVPPVSSGITVSVSEVVAGQAGGPR